MDREADLTGLPVPEPDFEVLVEAQVPAGAPVPQAVIGRMVVRQMPAMRQVITPGSDGFMRLFRHIDSRGIAMTTPVVMPMDGVQPVAMAFLYPEPSIGQTGQTEDPRVAVVDVPAQEVLVTGFRGRPNRLELAAAEQALRREAMRLGRVADGRTRLLGYNSPFVLPGRSYWELELVLGTLTP